MHKETVKACFIQPIFYSGAITVMATLWLLFMSPVLLESSDIQFALIFGFLGFFGFLSSVCFVSINWQKIFSRQEPQGDNKNLALGLDDDEGGENIAETLPDDKDKKIEAIKAELDFDAEAIRYRIRDDKYLDILMYSAGKPYVKTFTLSKNKTMLINRNGGLSINGTFTVGPIEKKSAINNFTGQMLVSSRQVDETDYATINVIAGTTSIPICGYGFDNNVFKNNLDLLRESYSKLNGALAKIFNDAAGNSDFEEVRASSDEIKILDKLLSCNNAKGQEC